MLILRYVFLGSQKKKSASHPSGENPQDNNQQFQPDRRVHRHLHAIAYARAIHDAGETLKHLSVFGQGQITKKSWQDGMP
jgi:hypothetical protein